MTSFRYQNQPCTLLSSRTLFGREVCTVYLAESGRVLELGREDLVCEDSNRVLTKDEIIAVASVGKVDEAVGIRSSIYFNRYYLSPLLGKGVIARTDPDHPKSPRQRYCLT